jgi:transcriptional regulator with XRE-family HTH domain
MEGIGGILRDARERRGVTFEDIEESTKIKKRYLLALEMEAWDQMPGKVYAKGFLRTYARYLGVDEQSLSDLFELAMASKEPGRAGSSHQLDDRAVKRKSAKRRREVDLHNKPKKSLTYVLCALSIAILAFCVWAYQNYQENDDAEKYIAPPIVFPTPEPTPVVVAEPEPEPVILTSIHLKMDATEPCWLRLVDGEDVIYEGTLMSGDTREFTDLQTINVRLGNAGGIILTLNGLELPKFGASGQIVTKYFSISDGVMYDDETGETLS